MTETPHLGNSYALTIHTITRKGTYEPYSASMNQCKDIGHGKYGFEVVAAFGPELNENGWLVDHNDINNAIQDFEIEGSCEEMHKQILGAVKARIAKVTEGTSVKCLGFKISIYADMTKTRTVAYMRTYHAIADPIVFHALNG